MKALKLPQIQSLELHRGSEPWSRLELRIQAEEPPDSPWREELDPEILLLTRRRAARMLRFWREYGQPALVPGRPKIFSALVFWFVAGGMKEVASEK